MNIVDEIAEARALHMSQNFKTLSMQNELIRKRALSIIQDSYKLYAEEYPYSDYFKDFVSGALRYDAGNASLKQLTSVRRILRDAVGRRVFLENAKCYYAAQAAIYASYSITKLEHARITEQDIADALKSSNSFAAKAVTV